MLLVHYYDHNDRMGRKHVLSNAHVCKNEDAAQGTNSSISRLQSAVCRDRQFNKGLYHCTWRPKHGGRGLLHDLSHQHNLALS